MLTAYFDNDKRKNKRMRTTNLATSCLHVWFITEVRQAAKTDEIFRIYAIKMTENVVDISAISLNRNDSHSEDPSCGDVCGHINENLSDDLVSEALKSGVDLRQYSRQIEKELKEVENASIQDYIKESQNIASLHNQIAACDGILERMEQMLQTFQSDLGSISHEILNLQEQSISMNIKLKNRQVFFFAFILYNSDVDYEPMESDNETIDSYECDDVDLSEHEDDGVMLSDSWKRIADIFSDCRPNSLPELVCNFSGVNPALNCNANNSVLDCFKKFITNDVIDYLVKCINERAKHFVKENRIARSAGATPLSVRGELSQFVDDMIVPENMIYDILDKPVTEKEFLDQLCILDHKLTFVKEQSFKDARSCLDVKDCLEKLKIKAITKIREYLLQKIYQFKKPMTNYQIPQNALLKHKYFFKFLMTYEREIAKEVRDEYVDTMSKIYYSYFKSYTTKLMKLQSIMATISNIPADVTIQWIPSHVGIAGNEKADYLAKTATCLGPIQVQMVSLSSYLGKISSSNSEVWHLRWSSKPILRNKSTVFTVGNRGDVLTTELESAIIVPHHAQKTEIKHSFESLFRSQQFALVDNACREYLFIKEFFIVSGRAVEELFNSVMGKTLTMFLKHVDVYVQDCYDSIALFLCIHIIFRFEELMQKRDIPCLEKYWSALLELLWPRFEYVLKINTQSIRDCDPRKLGNIDKRPHYVTRRYTELASVIVGINKTYPNERVGVLLLMLQEEVENFILRMAAEFQERKDQLIFLVNNYDLILSVLNERMKEDSKESETFRELLNSRTEEYVDEVLSQYFGGMITFVKEAEKAEGNLLNTELSRRDEKRVTDIIRLFSREWKTSVESINQAVVTSFSNFKHGTNVLQAALAQLIQYYHRFQKILSMAPFKTLSARSELINIHHLMVEVKKYKSSF
ncbi:Vacuolar protein sorting-associated protein 52 [Nymphon striatum]|nr:Vacuolar protein sorting-associated protein 52 [Nymphon striatum]